MPEVTVVSPFAITYDGNDADQHIISARPLGSSIIGASKLYSSVVHYAALGRIPPRGNYRRTFECYAMPARERCFEYSVLIAALGNEWALHGPLYQAGIKFVFAKIIDALKNIWVKPGEAVRVTEILADVMKEQARLNAEVQMVLANGIVQANNNLADLHSRLIDTLPSLANATRFSGAQLVAPVGTTCKTLRQFSRTPEETSINEPEADVIRGGSDMEVDEVQEFHCREITELNRETGHCILHLEGVEKAVTGKISDPLLAQPDNIYSRALNDHGPFRITAKPVRKGGALHKLYVSDAKR